MTQDNSSPSSRIFASPAVAALDVLATVRKSPPVRQIQNVGGNLISLFPSAKTGKIIQCESLPEATHVILLEYDPSVVAFYDQPLKIPITRAVNQSVRHTTHVPDFLVQRTDRIGFEEVKPQAAYDRDRDKIEEKIYQARQWAEARGLYYEFITEERWPDSTTLENIQFLACFRFRPRILDEVGTLLRDVVDMDPGISVHDLAHAIDVFAPEELLPCIWHLSFRQQFALDLSTRLLRHGGLEQFPVYPRLIPYR